MTSIENILKLATIFLQSATKDNKPKYTLMWCNPDKQDQWDIYQSGLSRARAERLAKEVSYFLGPKWFGKNIPTKIESDAPPRYKLHTVDGNVVELTLQEFLSVNEFHPEEVAELRALAPGQTYSGGGGAQPEWKITRI